MTTYELPFSAIQHRIAYRLADNVFRLFDFNLVIVDEENNIALVIATGTKDKEKSNEPPSKN